MKYFTSLFTFLALLVAPFCVQAESLIEPDYDGHSPLVTTPWILTGYTADQQQVDLNYIKAMRPHHVGALTMSEEYLNSPDAQSERLQGLAKGIIHNQKFEIKMLDMVENYARAADFSDNAAITHKVADQGIAMRDRYIRMPMPPIQNIFAGGDTASAEDVRFAKAMIVHHEGALMMAENYLDNPNARNGYLELLNLDVLRDQAQEIQLMKNIIATYPGDADAIKVDPTMIHGMDDMLHKMDMHVSHE